MILFVLFCVGLAALYIIWPQIQPHTTLHIGDGVFNTQIAKTPEERQKGLSGTAELRPDEGLIFIYEFDDKWPIWMKDMHYPIDIIWLDKDKRVVYIVTNAPPESYPDTTFAPKKDARYVIELPAGTADKKAIKVNGQATFDEYKQDGWGL